MRQLLPLALAIVLLLFSCKKEEIDNTDKGFPIDLTVETTGQSAQLTWTSTNISSFEEYLIVRSVDPIPTGQSPNANFIVKRIDDFTEVTFSDAGLSFEAELHYKVYVDIGDRFLESPSVISTRNILKYDFVAEDIIYDETQDVFFLNDVLTSTIKRFDVAQNRITNTAIVSSFEDFIVGDNGGARELYVSSKSNGLIQIFNAATLELKDQFSIGERAYAIETNNRGLLFFTTDDFDNHFKVFKRSDFSLVGETDNNEFSSQRRLKMVNEETNELIEATEDGLFYYRFDDNGNFMEGRSNTALFGFVLKNIRLTPDKTQFIPYQSGEFFNLDLSFSNGGIFGNDVGDFIFSPDGNQFAAGFNFFGFVQVFSLPDFQVVDGFDMFLNGIQYMVPFGDDGAYYAVGWQDEFNGQVSFIRTLQFQ